MLSSSLFSKVNCYASRFKSANFHGRTNKYPSNYFYPTSILHSINAFSTSANQKLNTASKDHEAASEMLKHSYLLMSGYPRGVGVLVDYGLSKKLDDTVWSTTRSTLLKQPLSLTELFLALCHDTEALYSTHYPHTEYPRPKLLELLLTVDYIKQSKDPDTKKFVDSTEAVATSYDTNNNYLLCTRLNYLITLFKAVLPHLPSKDLLRYFKGSPGTPYIDPSLYDAQVLFEDLIVNPRKYTMQTWYERAVAMTILCRSRAPVTATQYGPVCVPITPNIAQSVNNITVRTTYSSTDPIYPSSDPGAQLVVTAPGTQPFNARLTYTDTTSGPAASAATTTAVYVFTTIPSPSLSDKERCEARAKAIIYTLIHHFRSLGTTPPPPLEQLHMIFYDWTPLSDPLASTQYLTEALLPQLTAAPLSSSLTVAQTLLVERYVEEYIQTNVYIVDQEKIEQWLVPSFLPIPHIVSKVAEFEGRD